MHRGLQWGLGVGGFVAALGGGVFGGVWISKAGECAGGCSDAYTGAAAGGFVVAAIGLVLVTGWVALMILQPEPAPLRRNR
jgi:hypothetical protein